MPSGLKRSVPWDTPWINWAVKILSFGSGSLSFPSTPVEYVAIFNVSPSLRHGINPSLFTTGGLSLTESTDNITVYTEPLHSPSESL